MTAESGVAKLSITMTEGGPSLGGSFCSGDKYPVADAQRPAIPRKAPVNHSARSLLMAKSYHVDRHLFESQL